MDIKRAGPLDISVLVQMLVEMHEGTEIKTPAIDSMKMIGKVNEVIHKGIVLVAVNEEKQLIGSVGGMVSQDWWSEEKFLADYWFYVRPQHRKGNVALKLIKNFIKMANDAKLPVRLGHVFSGDLDRKDKFFERLGMVKAGSVFVEA